MKTSIFISLFALTIIFSSCGTSRNISRSESQLSYFDPQGYNLYSEVSSDIAVMDDKDKLLQENEAGNVELKKERKIIRNASYNLIVKEVDTISKTIEQIAEKHQGYVQESGTHRVTIRVKSEDFDQVIQEIEVLGKVDYKNIYGQDVSGQYYDAQIRLDNALKSRLRYLELLEQAENVQAALLVEKELERLNGTIEMLKAQMNNIDDLATFATISVSLQEKKKLGVLGYVAKGVWVGVKWLFVRN